MYSRLYLAALWTSWSFSGNLSSFSSFFFASCVDRHFVVGTGNRHIIYFQLLKKNPLLHFEFFITEGLKGSVCIMLCNSSVHQPWRRSAAGSSRACWPWCQPVRGGTTVWSPQHYQHNRPEKRRPLCYSCHVSNVFLPHFSPGPIIIKGLNKHFKKTIFCVASRSGIRLFQDSENLRVFQCSGWTERLISASSSKPFNHLCDLLHSWCFQPAAPDAG